MVGIGVLGTALTLPYTVFVFVFHTQLRRSCPEVSKQVPKL